MKNHWFFLVVGGSRAQNDEKPLVFVGFWSLPELIPGSRGSRGSSRSSGSGPSTTARDLPSTRAGVQNVEKPLVFVGFWSLPELIPGAL